jgi:ribosomal protein S18 acetylase RimI-like enzyme
MGVTLRRFRTGDEASISGLIVRCLREVSARDYPADVINRLCQHYSAATIGALATERDLHVAEVDGTIAGTVSRDGHQVFTLFIDPGHGGRGLGRQLMDRVEADAAAAGFGTMETAASITAHGFYRKRGYTDIRESRTEFGLTFIMRKTL